MWTSLSAALTTDNPAGALVHRCLQLGGAPAGGAGYVGGATPGGGCRHLTGTSHLRHLAVKVLTGT